MRVGSTNTTAVQNGEITQTKGPKSAESARTKRADPSNAAKNSESVKSDISAKGREFAKAKAVVSGTPDVREEKIAALRRQIEANTYKVDSEAIADRMVDEHLKTADLG